MLLSFKLKEIYVPEMVDRPMVLRLIFHYFFRQIKYLITLEESYRYRDLAIRPLLFKERTGDNETQAAGQINEISRTKIWDRSHVVC